MHHAGLRIIKALPETHRGLLINACVELGISAPVNQDGSRYRGHIDPAKYILKNMEDSMLYRPPKSPTSRPCVASQREHNSDGIAMEIKPGMASGQGIGDQEDFTTENGRHHHSAYELHQCGSFVNR